MKISIIVAVADNWVIGKSNSLPWYLPADLKHFKEITMGHHIIMGKKTHESIKKVLPGRTNITLSSDPSYLAEGCVVVNSLQNALEVAKENGEEEVFIIGGATVYKEALQLTDKIYLTRIYHNFDGDVFFPKIDFSKWKLVSSEKHEPDSKNPYSYDFNVYDKL